MTLREYLESYDLNESFQRNQYEKNKKIYKTRREERKEEAEINNVKKTQVEKILKQISDVKDVIASNEENILELNNYLKKTKKVKKPIMTGTNRWKIPSMPKEQWEEKKEKTLEGIKNVINLCKSKKIELQKKLADLQKKLKEVEETYR